MLPFVNAADPKLDYLTDGIAESIINSLSQLETIRVVPRSVVFRYKGMQVDPATVGAALNVKTILTGRVTQHGDMLHIQAELVDTTTESQLWGEQFRQNVSDLMTVQEEIAWQISEALRLKLTAAQKKKLRKRATVNPEAYQAYLRGRHHWNNWTPEGFRRALEAVPAGDRSRSARTRWPTPGSGTPTARWPTTVTSIPRQGFAQAPAPPPSGRWSSTPIWRTPTSPWRSGSCSRRGAGRRRRELQQAIALNPKHALAHAVNALYLTTCGSSTNR